MKTLVINMENDVDRLSKIKSQFLEQAIDHEVIKAVDGSKHDMTNVTDMCKMICTKSMIGIMLSHISCWQYIVDNNLESAIILEDDVILEDNFVASAGNLIKSLKYEDKNSWELILLGCFLCTYSGNDLLTKFIMKVNNPMQEASDKAYNDLLYIPRSWGGTHAYMLSNKGARRLLEKLPKASYHVDFQIAHTDIKTLAARKKLATQRADAADSHNATSIPLLNVVKLDHGELDLDFILTMPGMQILGVKITLLLVLQILLVLIISYIAWKKQIFKHVK